jgi:2-polyprenyl-3-methyl-5-hydroxy-6-metoxy-1,4-benzoquinol methylase
MTMNTSADRNPIAYRSMATQWLACPVCESTQFDTLTRADRYRMGVRTCQCRGCGLAMTNPVPEAAALSAFYENEYRRYYRGVERPSPEHIDAYGLGVRAQSTSAFMATARLLDEAPRVLDVGCAEGSLLRAIGSRAAQRVGIEPNPLFADYARSWANAEVYRDLAEVEAVAATFDLIIVNHVLEHVREPVPFLRRLAALCTPRGVIYVDVPDATRYSSLDDLHIAHLYHFSSASLQNIAQRAQLRVARIERHEPTRHPPSVRAVLAPVAAAGAVIADAEAPLVRQRIRRIGLLAPMIRFRRSPFGRMLLNGPLGALRALRHHQSQT